MSEPMFYYADDLNQAIAKAGNYLAEVRPIKHQSEAHSRFKDIESNVSVREGFTRDDYEYFRPAEEQPQKKKGRIRACDKAYEKVGLIRNVIDLMGDFTCQGIKINHPDPDTEHLGRAWFHKIDGPERSERFANLLYRQGNVVVQRNTAKLKPKSIRDLKRTYAARVEFVDVEKIGKGHIPVEYRFISPLLVDFVGSELVNFLNKKILKMPISTKLRRIIQQPTPQEKELLKSIPKNVIEAVKSNKNEVILEDVKCYHYKKDDWELWATPMLYAILDDLIMLEKLKLADLTALDGAISYVRIWKLGSLEHKIVPSPSALAKLSNILLHSVPGGTLDFVWGPELTVDSTSLDISKVLGIEKYEPTWLNIYGGLGIPQTLTGQGNKGGFTNNYLSLKTLVERLNYGRSILTKFWQEELAVFQQSMGIKQPFKVSYDVMLLNDENTYKNLLIQLVDRNIISDKTLRERFGESEIEEQRIKRETDLREKQLPEKLGPFIQDKGEPGEGKPLGQKDKIKRKTKKVKPIGLGSIESVIPVLSWAKSAVRQIGEIANPILLAKYNKKNMRQLTDQEFKEAEQTKFSILFSLKPFTKITEEVITKNFQSSLPDYAVSVYKGLVEQAENATVEDLRDFQALTYSVLNEEV